MTLIVERPSQAADIQSALDCGERVVVACFAVSDESLCVRDGSDITIHPGATLRFTGTGGVRAPDGRCDGARLGGGGTLQGGLDLTNISGFHGHDVVIDTTDLPGFADIPALIVGAGEGQYYNRFYGLRISARKKAIALYGGANCFELRGGDLHLYDEDAEAILCDATAANLNRVLLECSVEGVSGTALRIKGGATTTAHVREAVSCEWSGAGSKRVHADGKYRVIHMDTHADLDDMGADGWFSQPLWFGYGMPYAYGNLPTPSARMRP